MISPPLCTLSKGPAMLYDFRLQPLVGKCTEGGCRFFRFHNHPYFRRNLPRHHTHGLKLQHSRLDARVWQQWRAQSISGCSQLRPGCCVLPFFARKIALRCKLLQLASPTVCVFSRSLKNQPGTDSSRTNVPLLLCNSRFFLPTMWPSVCVCVCVSAPCLLAYIT